MHSLIIMREGKGGTEAGAQCWTHTYMLIPHQSPIISGSIHLSWVSVSLHKITQRPFVKAGNKSQWNCFFLALIWLPILSLNYYNPLSACLPPSLCLSHTNMIFSSLPLIVSPFLLPSVSLFVPPSLLSPQMCTDSTQKRFPLFQGYNKQLFAVWNNKDCHHGYS